MEKEKDNTNAAEDHSKKEMICGRGKPNVFLVILDTFVLIDILIFEAKTKEGPLERIESQWQTVFGAFGKLGR